MNKISILLITIMLITTPAFSAQNKTMKSKQSTGKWKVDSKIDPIDDARINYLTLKADKGSSISGTPFKLILRCTENKMDLFIIWNEYISEDQPQITLRFDKAVAENYLWHASTDHAATFYNDYEINDLLRKLTKTHIFIAQVTPYQKPPSTALFDVRYLQSALDKLVKQCPLIDLAGKPNETESSNTTTVSP